jgi:Ca-activated chloride channel family protein
MMFLWPKMLWFLMVIPIFVGWYFILQRRRQQIAERFGGLGFGPVRGPGLRRHIAPLLFLAGLLVLIVALARPQAQVQLPGPKGAVILAFDVSGSMAATDMEPTRMDAAKAAALDFVAQQPEGVQIGIVAFSDNGLAVQAPTTDPAAIRSAIDRLKPQRGTSLAQGIQAALQAIAVDAGQEGVTIPGADPVGPNDPSSDPQAAPAETGPLPGAIVLLSDGENNERPDPLAAAQVAADRAVRIYTVGIGSPGGSDLTIDGFNIHTQLDEATLQQIAALTDGEYYNAQTAQDLRAIYENLDTQWVIETQSMEITALFAAAAMVFFLVGGLLSLAWFGRWP